MNEYNELFYIISQYIVFNYDLYVFPQSIYSVLQVISFKK